MASDSLVPESEQKPARLVVRWKSAINTGKPNSEDGDLRKRAELREKMRLSISDQESQGKRVNRDAKVDNKQETTHYNERDEEYIMQRKAMIREVETRLEIEKKTLHDKDIKLLTRELEREREFLAIQEKQRQRILEAKVKLEKEADARMDEELAKQKLEREEEYTLLLKEDIDSFETVRRERLQTHRQGLIDRELEVMRVEREAMLRRVREAVEEFEKVTTEDMKNEMLDKVSKSAMDLKVRVAEKELKELARSVKERVQAEAENLRQHLERTADAEIAVLKLEIVEQKRQEMLQEVDLSKAELKSEMVRMEKAYKDEVGSRRQNSRDESEMIKAATAADEAGKSAGTRSEANCGTTSNTALVNALQKAVYDMLLNLVLKEKNEPKESCSCEDNYREMKNWMSGFEKKIRKLMMVSKEETREAVASLRIDLERNSVGQARRGNCACQQQQHLVCEDQLRASYNRAIDPTECSSLRNVHAARHFHPVGRSSGCGCGSLAYYDGGHREPRMTARHMKEQWNFDVDSESDSGSDIRVSRLGKYKREKSMLKDKKKKKSGATTTTPWCDSRDPTIGGGRAGKQKCTTRSTISGVQRSGKRTMECKAEEIEQETTTNADEPAHSSFSNSSCNSGSSAGRTAAAAAAAQRRRGGRLNRIRKGLFVVKGKLLKWSRRPTRSQSGIRKSDIAKIQLECRKKLRQLPIGIRWKVARLARRSPQNSKHFCAAVDDWPNLEVDSADFLNDASPSQSYQAVNKQALPFA